MVVFDIESLGTKSSSIILSMAAVYFDLDAAPGPAEMRAGAFFAKFDVVDQRHRLERKMDKSTMDWWAKQCDNVKKVSFIPNEMDCTFEEGHAALKNWVEANNAKDDWVWARGGMDQLILEDITEQVGLEPIWQFHQWRDVRTAVDILFETGNGYCEVEYPGFDRNHHITKHNPIDDCVLDAMMLMYGKKSS
jgi:3' exoribonuclease, RNase T-like